MDTVVPTPAAEALPEVTSELVAEPERRRPWWPLALYAVSGLLVVGAVLVTTSAARTRTSADESAERAHVLFQEQSEAQKDGAAAAGMAEDLVAQVRVVERALQDWDAASDRYLNTRDEFVDAGNAAIDLGNAGQFEEAVARFEGEVSDRLADLEPLIVTVEDGQDELAVAVRRLGRLLDELKEATR